MSVFGVTANEEEIYRLFLRNPETRADDIHLLLGTDRGQARQLLDRLGELGLLKFEGARITPTDPETALSRLTDLRLHQLHKELQRVTQSRHVLDALRAEQGARSDAPQSVEQLQDLVQIRNRIDDLAFFAREEILSVEPYTELSRENIDHARPLDLRCLRRGVVIRSVVLRTALSHGATAGYLRELSSHGARIRVAEDIGERLLVYDRSTALVPIDPHDTARGALLAHESGLVANIIALFEKIWDQAEELPAESGGNTAGGARQTPTETEQRVLECMCSGDKDEAAARELGISVRTYRRHVADLMRLLGAASRAQAALLARERGWI